jgi:hypothetical protein
MADADAGLLLGSLSAAACAEHAHCPVLIDHGRLGSESSHATASEETP